MIFFVIFFSIFSSYLLFFFGSVYIEKIKQGAVLNFSLFITSLTKSQPKKKISYKYFLFITLLNCIALFFLQEQRLWLPENPNINLTLCFIWITILNLLARIDLHTGFLPNALTYVLWLIGGVVQVLTASTDGWQTVFLSLVLLLSGYIFQYLSLKVVKRSLIGLGDIKWLAGIWLWTNASFLVTLIFISSALFLIFHNDKRKITCAYPFGPFIFVGVILTHVFYAV